LHVRAARTCAILIDDDFALCLRVERKDAKSGKEQYKDEKASRDAIWRC